MIPWNFECWKLITKCSSFDPYPKFTFESSLERQLVVKTMELIRKIPSNLKFVPSIIVPEVGLFTLLKLYSFLNFKHRMWLKAQFHSISTGQVRTCSFLKLFWQRSSLVSPGLQNRTIKIFTAFEVIKQSDSPDLCRLHRGCDLEEFHTRMCWRTFSFFLFF